MGQQESFASFCQKVDEIAVVSRTDVRQSRVCRVDVGRNGRIQQRLQRRLLTHPSELKKPKKIKKDEENPRVSKE